MRLLKRLSSRMPRLLLLGLVVLLAQAWLVSNAKAATQCSASATGMSFGTLAATGNTDASATLSLNCSTSGGAFLGYTYVTMCLDIGAGSGGGAPSRRMLNGFSDALAFDLYQDPARSTIWGGSAYQPPPPEVRFRYFTFLGSGSYSNSVTLHGRIPPQTGLAAGSYQSLFSGADARVRFRYDEGGSNYPNSCNAGGDSGNASGSFPFTINATIPDHCELGIANDLDFGNVPGLINANRDQSSSISLTCTRRTPWQLGLNNGLHANGSQRRMRSGSGQFVRYELYRNAARSQRWGSTLNVDTELGTGSGTSQSISVHGRVPSPQSVPAGNYSDTIVVTVTY